jgi:hypothetical protein
MENFTEGNLKAARDGAQGLLGEVMELRLNILQERDEVISAFSPPLQHLIDLDDLAHL